MLKKILIASFIMLVSFAAANAQFITNQKGKVMLKGKVVNMQTGEPLQVSIELRNSEGKRIMKFENNSNTGEFQQLLDAGKTFTLVFTNYNILREEREVKIKQGEGYTEQEEVFELPVLKIGTDVCKLDAFDKSEATLNPQAKKRLDHLKIQMRFNRSVKFDFLISGSGALQQKRVQAVSDYISDWGYFTRRIEVKASDVKSDLVIRVSELEDVFD